MTHPLADMPDRPPGRGPSGTAATGEPSLSMQQRTVLERLITRLVALTSQQNAEVWACENCTVQCSTVRPCTVR